MGQAGDFTNEIEITDAMMEAGRRAYYDCDPRFCDLDTIIGCVFEAMAIAGSRRPVPA